MLYRYATTVIFRRTTTSVTATTPAASGVIQLEAQVTSGTTEPSAPVGAVQFYADGHTVGHPVRLNGSGLARLMTRLPAAVSSRTVTAVYSGDSFYNSSTSQAVPVG